MKNEHNLNSILQVVKDITEGKWNRDVDVDAKGMVGELAQYINQTLKNLRQLDENLGVGVKETPRAMSEVQVIIDQTEKATIRVLDNSESILETSRSLRESLDEMRLEPSTDKQKKTLNHMEGRVGQLEQIAYELINSMEFQDITQQKIKSITSCLANIERRLVDLLIIFKIQSNQDQVSDEVQLLKSLHDQEDTGATQDLVDQLLAEFGI